MVCGRDYKMAELKWTPEMEVSLFRAMQDHKPVGFNKHWHMLCIHNRMVAIGGVAITIDAIWEHLQILYDLNSLDELENTSSPPSLEFQLPLNFTLCIKQEETIDEASSTPCKRSRSSNSPSPSESPQRNKRKRTH